MFKKISGVRSSDEGFIFGEQREGNARRAESDTRCVGGGSQVDHVDAQRLAAQRVNQHLSDGAAECVKSNGVRWIWAGKWNSYIRTKLAEFERRIVLRIFICVNNGPLSELETDETKLKMIEDEKFLNSKQTSFDSS